MSNTEAGADDPLEIPVFFSGAVDVQLHKFRSAHTRICTPRHPNDDRRPDFCAAAAAITALRDMSRDTYFRDNHPVDCEIVRGIVVALEVMFASLTMRYLL